MLEAADQSTDANDAGVTPATATELDEMMADLWPELQTDLATISSAATHHVIDESGHFIQNDKPAAVVDAITEVLDRIAEP